MDLVRGRSRLSILPPAHLAPRPAPHNHLSADGGDALEHCADGAPIGPCAREHATPCDTAGVSMSVSILPYWMAYLTTQGEYGIQAGRGRIAASCVAFAPGIPPCAAHPAQGGGPRPRLGHGWSTAVAATAPNPRVDLAVCAVSLALAAGMRLASDCREVASPGSGRWAALNMIRRKGDRGCALHCLRVSGSGSECSAVQGPLLGAVAHFQVFPFLTFSHPSRSRSFRFKEERV